jgi:hypothetical protein
MASTSWLASSDALPPSPGELIKTHRARLALEEDKRAHQRRLDLEEQRSSLNSPADRIRVWEKLHGLRLPSDPSHPVLDVIAIGTRLTLSQVLEEQRARAAKGPSEPAQIDAG